MVTGDYIKGRADKNGGIRETVVVQGSCSRKDNQEFIRDPFVREFRRQFNSGVFSCGL
jgi:hypothetical protein